MVKMTTGERMAKIEEKVENTHEQLKMHITEQREDFDKIIEKLDSLNDSFAGKWVEKVAVGTLITIIGGTIILLLQVL